MDDNFTIKIWFKYLFSLKFDADILCKLIVRKVIPLNFYDAFTF